MNFYIYNFLNNDSLSQELKFNFSDNLGKFEVNTFSDGEKQVVFKDVFNGESVYVISPAKTADDWLTLIMALGALRRADIKSVNVILPYMGYMRQDSKNDEQSICSSLKLFAELLEQNGVTQVAVVDPHSEAINEYFKKTKFITLSAQPSLTREFQKFYKKNHANEHLTIVAPDKGSKKLALAYQKDMPDIKTSIVTIEKQRIKANEVESMKVAGDVRGKNVVLVDDMADTCGTLVLAVDILQKQGAKSVYAIVTHPILSGNAQDKIKNSSIKKLFVSNTLNFESMIPKIKVVDVNSVVINHFDNLLKNQQIENIL